MCELNLFLDDERRPEDIKWIRLPLNSWYIVRSYNEFCKFIKTQGVPERVSFDHDLADLRDDDLEKTGFHCLKFLLEWCIDNHKDLPEIFIHTMNPVGRERMESLIETYHKYRVEV